MSLVDYPLSQWKFDEKVTKEFDEHVRQSVPEYETFQNMIVYLSDYFIQNDGVIYDLGCATGETIQSINKRHKSKNNLFIGVDESNEMLKNTFIKNKNINRMQLVNQKIEDFDFNYKSNLILSVLTLQFVPIEQRKNIIHKVYEALNTGGAFIFVDKMYPNYANIQEIFTQVHHDEKELNGLSDTDIRNKDKSLRSVLMPLTLNDNMELLQSVGFKTIEIFNKHLNFTGIIAIK